MKKAGLGLKIMIFTFLLVVVTSGVLIYFTYKTSYDDLEKSLAQRLEGIAATGALMIDGDKHEQVWASKDPNSPEFKEIQKVLRGIKEKNNLKEEIYTFKRVGEEVRFVVMSHHGKPFVGDPYVLKKEMLPALNKGMPSHTSIFEDKQGTWISAYAPIYDSQGHIVGILDVDIHLEQFLENLSMKTRRLLIISAVILLVGLIISFLLSRRLVKHLKYLTAITEKISTGQVDRSIKVNSRDEVGELAESLERMRVSLKMAMEMIDEDEKEED